jgi:hypothetical protein
MKIGYFFLLKIKLGKRSEAKDGINIKCFVEKPFEILRIINLRILLCLSGINRTALREIKLLQEISHENIIGVSAYIHKFIFSRLYTDSSSFTASNSNVLQSGKCEACQSPAMLCSSFTLYWSI